MPAPTIIADHFETPPRIGCSGDAGPPKADQKTGAERTGIECAPRKQRYTLPPEVPVDRIANFLFEVGMLKRTPRTGWQFLAGARGESVADHSFRVAMIAFVLTRIGDDEVDADHALSLALVHDLPEARTSDLNYMNQKYVRVDEERAAADMIHGLPFAEELDALLAEYRAEETPESIVAHDADQLELLLQLVEQRDAGVPSTDDWVPFVLKRLRTNGGKKLAQSILAGDSSSWWFDRDSSWWIRGGKG